jgi:hypothetical protein
MFHPHRAPPYPTGLPAGPPRWAPPLGYRSPPAGPLPRKQEGGMIDFQPSLRFSEYFATTTTVKIRAGAITSIFVIVRLIRLVLMHGQ